eukprot:scaffold60556_cov62-Phaeocystis_antarctica.AAC.2
MNQQTGSERLPTRRDAVPAARPYAALCWTMCWARWLCWTVARSASGGAATLRRQASCLMWPAPPAPGELRLI